MAGTCSRLFATLTVRPDKTPRRASLRRAENWLRNVERAVDCKDRLNYEHALAREAASIYYCIRVCSQITIITDKSVYVPTIYVQRDFYDL